MRRLNLWLTLALSALLLSSCEYDDGALWGKVNELEQQVNKNTEEIATLNSLVEALNQGKMITSAQQSEKGYTLTLSDGSEIVILNSIFTSVEETDGMLVITLTDGRVIKLPVINYELRTLTFEDEDYQGTEDNAATYWSDLISDGQYGNGNGRYSWWDENNTDLLFYPSPTAMFPGYGGHAVSCYVGDDLSLGNYMYDLQAYKVKGGANDSENFCVHFGYLDDSGMGMQNELIGFEFDDGVARTIDHMYVTNTTYVYNILTNGDGWMVPTGGVSDKCWFKIVAYGYDGDDNEVGTAEFYLWKEGRQGVEEWTKWDLSSLGKVVSVKFNLIGSDELYESGYGLGAPGYFAYDDVAVRFEKE